MTTHGFTKEYLNKLTVMKMKVAILLGLFFYAITGVTQAQGNWNWPSDGKMESRAKELNAAYNDYMRADQYVAATKPLHWLLQNVPDLNEAIYINGVTVYAGAAKETQDEAKKKVYQDSVITIYEKRAEIYDNEAEWIQNKAFYAYNFYKADKEKVAEAAAMFERALELNNTLPVSMVGAYFDLIYRNYAYNDAYTPEEILAKYEQLSELLAEAEKKGEDISGSQGILDQLLVNMEIIDCNFIANNMGPKLAADPDNLQLAQQIFQYSIQYKCTDNPAFLSALETIDNNDPTFSTSQARGRRYLQSDNYAQAQEMFQKALGLAKTDTERGDAHMDLARMFSSQGRKSDARAAAQKAAEADPSKAADAWTMIGNLYMTSFNDCKGGQSRVKDQSIYIAAYHAFAKAGNNGGMAEAKARFPSKEEIFTEGHQVGDSISTGCWIGQTVSLDTRD